MVVVDDTLLNFISQGDVALKVDSEALKLTNSLCVD